MDHSRSGSDIHDYRHLQDQHIMGFKRITRRPRNTHLEEWDPEMSALPNRGGMNASDLVENNRSRSAIHCSQQQQEKD
jgi:hypothetical protein